MNMTRKEQIDKACDDLVEDCCGTSDIYFAFIKGAEWADKNIPRCEDHRHYCHCGECVWWSGQQGINTVNVPDEK